MTHDREARIRQRAYDLWEAAGQPAGRDQEYWLAAEASVAAEEQGAPAPKPRARKAASAIAADPAAPAAAKAAPRKPRRTKASENLG